MQLVRGWEQDAKSGYLDSRAWSKSGHYPTLVIIIHLAGAASQVCENGAESGQGSKGEVIVTSPSKIAKVGKIRPRFE